MTFTVSSEIVSKLLPVAVLVISDSTLSVAGVTSSSGSPR
ncbi:hypothetical protein HMPREF0298_1778 [Corynebacterium lipophiloflavum DSM 44291]|uniref:Uncharacterized protein n=1 Tax=Corynebacterium lipophiloflavum (strain ATCC 700352 / DSM 44291 / CCUG 37336 / JCM 10383 / DMMZ 1944) TaxID=525263 RepID=C0XTK8_CORLD|nr:hypothetical protein HMPREF0298_1778 [Corynebacterium lipophiloflavum DSM 44291]